MEHEDIILLVNDSPDQLELMSALLSQVGYRIQTAGDGREGLDVARQQRPCLVISDVVMPRGDGIELCRAIRADNELHATPILLLSAERVDTRSAVEGLEAGADDYLEAPFDPMRLVAKVARLVERARSEAALRESEERFRLLVEGVHDYAIFMLNTEGRVTSWNAGVKRVLGYEEAELTGQHFHCIFTPEDVASGEPENELRTAETEGQAGDERWHIRRDGTRFWATGTVTPLRDEAGHLRGFAKVMRDQTERKIVEDRMAHEAVHDALTGLPNRVMFIEHLKRAVARAKRHEDYIFAVLFLDLDRFKVINDSLGHVIADQLLVEIARKIEKAMRPEDLIARFGGDEFIILLDDIGDITDAIRVANRINEELAAPFNLSGHEVFTSASIGIALS